MGNQLVWENRFNIGVDFINREHKKLFTIMNRLFAFSEQEDKSPWVCQEVIKYFKDHALKHFAEEEAYMATIYYKDLDMHRHLHEDFRLRMLPSLEKELEQTRYDKDAIDHFLGVCAGWLIGHTLTEDQAIVKESGTNKWVNLLPEEERIVLRQVIIRLLKDMFCLESRIVSECYGGEKFGNGIYYRLLYVTESGEQQEIILVFEEKLLLNTVGKIIGNESEKLDVMLMNAARYTARQFVERIKEYFPDNEKRSIRGENLLTFEQFERTFERQLPQHSLLFDTGAGYFAYCAMTPRKVKGTNEPSIRAENAMEEVQKYLLKNEEANNSRKKKLLVVDDSDVVLQALKRLLEKDYQVTLAKSGVAAIRCMTLEEPDLVLLDYNMPVCDGAQVLEMIRSETEFADVPVIFLTGRVDKSSISKIIPLKPAGYMLKSEKPAEIKRNIDAFFEGKSAGIS